MSENYHELSAGALFAEFAGSLTYGRQQWLCQKQVTVTF